MVGSRDEGSRRVDAALSVVIACYNGADTLGVQLAALARQRCPVPFEVLVCDNGSSDGSADVARSFVRRLPVRVVDAAGVQGAAHARNVGVAQSLGEYIAFCDADDEVADDWLEAIVRALRVHEFVAGRVDVHKLNSPQVARTRAMEQQQGLQESGTGLRLKHAGAGNMAFHRRVFEDVGGFDESLRCLEETDLCWRIQLAGADLVYVPDMVIHTRLRSTLSSMARQAYRYGASFAQLEGRYGMADRAERADGGSARLRDLPLTERIAGLAAAGVGGATWKAAWHVGYRVGRHELSCPRTAARTAKAA